MLLAVAAGTGGATLAISLPASAQTSETPSLQVTPIPDSLFPDPSGNVFDDALAPAADGAGEELILTGGAGDSTDLEASLAGAFSPPPSVPALGSTPFVAITDADGYDWALSDSGLYAIAPGGAATAFPVPTDAGLAPLFTDLAVGLDGNLYLADSNGNVDQCVITDAPSATCATQYPLATATSAMGASVFPSYQAPGPVSIAAAGSTLFLNTGNANFFTGAELGYVSEAGVFGLTNGQYDTGSDAAGNLVGTLSPYPHSLTLGADGHLWTAGANYTLPSGSSVPTYDDQPDAIDELSAATGTPSSEPGYDLKTYATGLPTGAEITSITTGPDGNLWFTEEISGQPGEIGQLNPVTGEITNYPLPSGFTLPGAGADMIAPGPAGSQTVWFVATSSTTPAQPAIGEITGVVQVVSTPARSTPAVSTATVTNTSSTISPPQFGNPNTPGVVSFGAIARVSKKGATGLLVSCDGSPASICLGSVALTARGSVAVKRGRKVVERTRTIKLGSADYVVSGGLQTDVTVALSKTAIAALAAAAGDKLSATATTLANSGVLVTSSVALLGPDATSSSTKKEAGKKK